MNWQSGTDDDQLRPRSSVTRRSDELAAELADVGVDEFVRRRVSAEDMPLKLMRDLSRAASVRDHDVHRYRQRRYEWTERRLQVLRLMADGYKDHEIASVLQIGYQTVKTHVKTIYAMLDARNRAHAVHLAHLNKII